MSEALKDLQALVLAENRRKHPSYPPEYFVTYKIENSANGITSAIVKYINLIGGMASRVNSMGTYDTKLKRYRPGTTRKGYADINATFGGKSIYIEVKHGKDRLRPEQVKFSEDVVRSGGYYFMATSFEDFHKWFNSVINNHKKTGVGRSGIKTFIH